jgi:AraC-like DNA-binding protein
MALSLDLLSILLIVTLFQGAFILSVLAIKYRLTGSQSRLLFLMVLTLIWFQAEFLSVRIPFDIRINLFYSTRYGAWFLLGPLYYFYVRSIIDRPFRKTLADGLHFVPFVVFVLVIPAVTPEFLSFRQVHYGMLTSFDPFNDSVSFLQYVYSTVFIIQFVHLLVYLISALYNIRQYERDLRGNYSSMNTTTLRWLTSVNVLLLLVLVFVSVFLILFFLNHSYNRDLDYLYVVPMALLVYLISYKLAGVQWPLALVSNEKAGKYEKSSLTTDQAKIYGRQLEEYLLKAKPYLNNELRLQELAEMLNIPPHHLSQVINEHLHTTFFDCINRHRVEEAKKLIAGDTGSPLLEIAFKAGFNNKTSFTNAFKKFAGQTPVNYRLQQRSKN